MFYISLIQATSVMFYLIGVACLPCMLVSIIFSIINMKIKRGFFKLNMDILRTSDERLKVINECYKDIRFVKLSATENYFLNRICELKDKETSFRKKLFNRIIILVTKNNMSLYFFIGTLIISMGLINGIDKINVVAIFTCLSAYMNYAGRLFNLPYTHSFFWVAIVSSERINEFLLSEEVNYEYIDWDQNTSSQSFSLGNDTVIEVKNGNFYWVDPKKSIYLDSKKQ